MILVLILELKDIKVPLSLNPVELGMLGIMVFLRELENHVI
jgi:hypothetical protein